MMKGLPTIIATAATITTIAAIIATTAINDVLYEKKPWALYYINTGYSLVSLIIVGIVLGVWQ